MLTKPFLRVSIKIEGTGQMCKDDEIVVLEHVTSPSVANFIVQALRFHGIPAYLDGCLLQDEFAMSQKALGNICSDIQVPRSCLDEAKKILAIMREAGEKLDADEEDES